MISFEREILETLRRRNPDLMNAFVCLGLAAEADGVVTMTAPGPLAHVPHKRRAGMISALVAAGFLKRAASGYLVDGVGGEGTGRRQLEDTKPTAAREASRCNTSLDNSEGSGSGQAGGSGPIPEEESEARALIDLLPGEPWVELAHDANIETTDDGQADGTEPTAGRKAPYGNISQNNSGWTEDKQTRDSEAADDELTGVFLDISDLDEPQPTAMTMGKGLRRPPAGISSAPAPAADDAARVDARAREMALEAWDGADARTFQTCEGEFEQFWTYRKRHFLELAGQEFTAS